jgi:CheY-like chemotaxis protein
MTANDTAWRPVEGCASGAANPNTRALVEQRYPGRRILIVDDDPVNRRILKIMLASAGLVTDTADDGREAIARAWQVRYDVILMDMQMPNVDGLEAARKILEIPGYLQTPIIAMTANTSAEAWGLCLAAGMTDYIAKPFDPQRLFLVLLYWLSQGGRPEPSALPAEGREAS